jgi:hypothetical protein
MSEQLITYKPLPPVQTNRATSILEALARQHGADPRKYVAFCRRSFTQARKGLGLPLKQRQRHTTAGLRKAIRCLNEASEILCKEGLGSHREALALIKGDTARRLEELLRAKKEENRRAGKTITKWTPSISTESARHYAGEFKLAIECNRGIKKLIRPDGKHLDELAAEAAEEGIIAEPDESTFIEALAENRKFPEAQDAESVRLCERRREEQEFLEYEERVSRLLQSATDRTQSNGEGVINTEEEAHSACLSKEGIHEVRTGTG